MSIKVKERKLVKIGNSAGFIIPKEDREQLDETSRYDLTITEARE
jgi:antitoxin component of MazEF toxin-antitoxin module